MPLDPEAQNFAQQVAIIVTHYEMGTTVTYCTSCGWTEDLGGFGIVKCPVCGCQDTRVKQLDGSGEWRNN
jgi:predicted nucleic-acid-binding Zn-ribbon protein